MAVGFAIIGFINPSFIMLTLIAVFIFFGASAEERMVRIKVAFEGKDARDFLPTGVRMLSTEDTIRSVVHSLQGSGTFVLPVTNAVGTLAGAVESNDLQQALDKGHGDDTVRRFVRTGFPLIDADMPASQAYYLLRSHKAPVAGIIQDNVFVGLVRFDDLARAIG